MSVVVPLVPLLVAPTEPLELRRLGPRSVVPERHGCDVVWGTAGGELAGVQRKELTDLWSSLQDGRLAREVAAMADLVLRVVVLEGRLRWSARGRLATARAPFTRDQLRGLVLSLQLRGIAVLHTDDLADTCAAVVHLRRWHAKPHHSALDHRPRTPPPTRAWGAHLLQSFPLVGPEVAGAVVDHFDGVPLAWTCTPDDLAAVRGVGPVRAAVMTDALHPVAARAPSRPLLPV
jgi:ERCC4-type nuclease